MTSFGIFSKLALIFTIGLLIQMHTADAGIVHPVQRTQNKVKNFLSTICSNVNSESALLCSINICSNIINKGCEAIGKEQPQWSSLVPDCKENLSNAVCGEFLTAAESVVGKEHNNVVSNPVQTETSSWTTRLFEYLGQGNANLKLSPHNM